MNRSNVVSCHAFKLGISSEQEARTTMEAMINIKVWLPNSLSEEGKVKSSVGAGFAVIVAY
ncbi:hypothetical protein [Coleofasciculus sp. E1-EBD-02]|uniref:hypothetical protein n=1 Tax=Coleofasciculus sp. E1-EBD-02 TaxID=3068481 RepID=UPI0032F7D8F8